MNPTESRSTHAPPGVAVVIPCFQAARTIGSVLSRIGPSVSHVYCVDDGSTDGTSAQILEWAARDDRVRLIRRRENGGVGAATIQGYRAAVAEGARVVVKIDADGQMNPDFIPDFVEPLLDGEADYVKGNRFFHIETVRRMPFARIFGNAGLSFLTKASSGYWNLFDPTNGYTAIRAEVARALPLDRIHKGYFFESDMLFRLGVLRARVIELPLETVYEEEVSHLSPFRCLLTFPALQLRNLFKRICYNHFLRGFSMASVNLVLGIALSGFGLGFGLREWMRSFQTGEPATAGTVMLSALPLLVGVQLVLNFIAHDMAMVPQDCIHDRIVRTRLLEGEDRAAQAHHRVAKAQDPDRQEPQQPDHPQVVHGG